MKKQPNARYLLQQPLYKVFSFALCGLALLVFAGCDLLGTKEISHAHLDALSTALSDELSAANAATVAAIGLTKTAVTDIAPTYQEEASLACAPLIERVKGGDYSEVVPGAVLTGCNFDGVDLYGLNLSQADLRAANLSGVDLTSASLQGVDLRFATLSRAKMAGASLLQAKLNGADFSGANMSGADLTSADLSYAVMKNTNLSSANLTGADLTKANLSGADLTGAIVSQVQLDQVVNLKNTKMPDGTVHE